MLVLDSGGVSRLAERSRQAAALILAFREEGLWPPLVSLHRSGGVFTGASGREALPNSFLRRDRQKQLVPVVEAVPRVMELLGEYPARSAGKFL